MSKKPSDSPLDLEQIRELIDLLIEKDVSEFAVEREGVKVKIRRGKAEISTPAAPVQHVVSSAAPAAAAMPPPAPAAPEAPEADSPASRAGVEDAFIVKSPMVGTFYRFPEPGAEAFTDVGETVEEGQTLCIVEAMKLMNEIIAEVGGEVVAIFVDNGEPVEYGQQLLAIRAGA
jgi:acetyl-CoA carboxylase biotin carboxyl carrier protein